MTEYRHVKGMSQLTQTLREFPKKLRRMALAQATLAAAVPIRDQARVNAPLYHGNVQDGHPPPGTLRKDIIVKGVPEKTTDTKVTYYVLVRRGQRLSTKALIAGKTRRQNAYYWWWVENGTSRMEGQFFMRNAFKQKQQEAIDAFAEKIRTAVRDLLPKAAAS